MKNQHDLLYFLPTLEKQNGWTNGMPERMTEDYKYTLIQALKRMKSNQIKA